ncbi:MAG: sulfotransferase [Paracoccaceae bacterium]|mgnify:FL=1
MSKPNFLIIGAMKCGTTTLQAQLACQPGIFMTDPKEPNYFSDDDVFAKGPDWYAGLYAEAAPSDLLGEASTHYTKLPTYPQTIARLKASVPNPRLVYMIRNPVTRAVSHYIHEWSQGIMGPDMIAEFAAHSEIVDYGRYAYQIAPYIAAFGREAIYLTSLETLKADEEGELARVAAHIGYTGTPAWNHDLGAQNVSAQRIRKFPLHSLLIDNPVAVGLRRTLVPKSIRSKIRDARMIGDRPELPDSLRAELERIYLQDRDDLARLLPGMPALDDAYPFVPA